MTTDRFRWAWPCAAALVLLLGHGVLRAQLFEDAAAPAKSGVPQTPDAQALARDVFNKVNQASYSLVQKDVLGLVATFRISCDGNPSGNVSVKWRCEQPRPELTFEGDLPEGLRDWVGGGFDWALRSSVLAYIPPEMPYPSYAMKVPDGFLVDCSADPTVSARLFAFSSDYLRVRDAQKLKNGTELMSEFETQKAEGTHFMSAMRRTMSRPGQPGGKLAYKLTYTHRNGLAFLKRVQMDEEIPEGKHSWTFELVDVSFTRDAGAGPVAAMPTPAKAEPANTAPGGKLLVTATPLGDAQYQADRDSTIESPDSSRIAFICTKDGKARAVIDGQPGKIYEGVAHGGLVFSPDGKRVAYAAKDADRQFIVADGVEGPRFNYIGMPVFSADSRKLGYCAVPGEGGCFTLIEGVEGKHYGNRMARLALSADGARVGFVIMHDTKFAAVIDDVEGKLYDDVNDIRFSPDGKRVAYRARAGEKSLMVVDGEEGGAYDSVSDFAFSPTGQDYIYVARRGDKMFVMLDGRESRPYAEVGWIMPLFNATGSRLAYMIRENGKQIMVVNGKQGKGYNRITNGSFVFGPDGKRWAHAACPADGQELIVLDGIEGRGYESVSSPTFSPDSQHLAYTARREGKKFLIVDGEERGPFPRDLSAPAFSPDSRHVAVVTLDYGPSATWRAIVGASQTPEAPGGMYSYRPVFDGPRSFHFLTRAGGDAYSRVQVQIAEP